MVMHYPT